MPNILPETEVREWLEKDEFEYAYATKSSPMTEVEGSLFGIYTNFTMVQ